MEPTIELILSPAADRRICSVCGKKATDIQCESCDPSHPICRDCVPHHHDDFNAVCG